MFARTRDGLTHMRIALKLAGAETPTVRPKGMPLFSVRPFQPRTDTAARSVVWLWARLCDELYLPEVLNGQRWPLTQPDRRRRPLMSIRILNRLAEGWIDAHGAVAV